MHKPRGSKIIEIDWLHDLEILVLTSHKQHKEFMKVEDLPDDFETAWTLNRGYVRVLEKDGIPAFIMGFPVPSRQTIIHEAVHVVHFIFENKGIPTGEENTEVVAYMVAWVCKKLFSMLKFK